MKKLVLCIKPAPISSLSWRIGTLDGGKQGNWQMVMIGGPSYACRPGSTHCKPNILSHQIIVGPTQKDDPHPYPADALNVIYLNTDGVSVTVCISFLNQLRILVSVQQSTAKYIMIWFCFPFPSSSIRPSLISNGFCKSWSSYSYNVFSCCQILLLSNETCK
jgi:hypothetical protein